MTTWGVYLQHPNGDVWQWELSHWKLVSSMLFHLAHSNVMIPKVSCVPLSLVPYLSDICGSTTRKKHHSICPFKFVVPFHIQWSPIAPCRTCRMHLGRWWLTILSGPRQKAQGAAGPGTTSARSQGRFQWWCWSKTESRTTSCTQGRWREGAIA